MRLTLGGVSGGKSAGRFFEALSHVLCGQFAKLNIFNNITVKIWGQGRERRAASLQLKSCIVFGLAGWINCWPVSLGAGRCFRYTLGQQL